MEPALIFNTDFQNFIFKQSKNSLCKELLEKLLDKDFNFDKDFLIQNCQNCKADLECFHKLNSGNYSIRKKVAQSSLYSDKNLKDVQYNQMIRSNIQTEKANYQLQTKYNNDKIILKVIMDQPQLDICSWYVQISDMSQCSQVVANVFQNLMELFEHIQDQSNIKVDVNNGIFSILLKTTIKNKQSLTQIAKIKLNAIKQPEVQELTTESIIQICKKDSQNLSNNLIKKILTFLTLKISNPSTSPEQDQQKFSPILDPIIHKIKVVGNSTQAMQHKIATIMQQIQQIKQINSKQVSVDLKQIKNIADEMKDYIETVKEGIDREIIRCENKQEIFVIEFRDKIEKVYMEIKNDNFQIRGLKQSIRNMKEYISNLQTQIIIQQTSKKQLKSQQKRSSQKSISSSIIKRVEKKDEIKPVCQYIDNKTGFFHHFIAKGWEVSKIQKTFGESTLLIGKATISISPVFTLKVKKLGDFPILIGIIDAKHRNQQYCEKNDNRIWFSSDGAAFNGQKQLRYEPTFGLNVQVKITVNLGISRITITVGKLKQYNLTCNILKKKDIQWYPCIWMGQTGDTIEWIQN